MARLLFAAGMLIALAFAGCLADVPAPTLPNVPVKLVPTTEPLWYNPQTFPHPAFNYPTLTNPPVNVSKDSWLYPIPARDLPKPIQGLSHVAQVAGGDFSGAGASVLGGIAVVPGKPTRFVDIRDPTHPVVVGTFKDGSRGSDTIVYPDGRVAAVMSVGQNHILFLNITDPKNVTEFGRVDTTAASHKVDVVPGTPIVYNSKSKEIFDASDPEHPVKVDAEAPHACHRTYFWIEPTQQKYRAYCAGYDVTEIWDIKEPTKPVLIVSIPMWHAKQGVPATAVVPATFSHLSIASQDGKTLIVGDEAGGGGWPACGADVGTPVRDASTPTGALWFYDITDEKNPTLKGWISPSSHAISNSDTMGSCTAHHGRIVPDPEGKRQLLVMGFYGGGVVLVDFTDASAPRVLDQFNDNTSVWEAIYYNGYVFTGDGNRGLDAIAFR